MPGFFATLISLHVMVAEPPPPPPQPMASIFEAVPTVETDVLGDLAASFEGIPVPVVDPFQNQVMVELHGTF